MKYVLITDASSGIGYEATKSFARLGKNLILVARRSAQLKQLKQQIKTINSNVDVVIKLVDLSITQNLLTLYQSLKPYQIEVLVNNAGFGLFAAVADSDITKVREMLQLNIKALCILQPFMFRITNK